MGLLLAVAVRADVAGLLFAVFAIFTFGLEAAGFALVRAAEILVLAMDML
jgi:hypothetical protein